MVVVAAVDASDTSAEVVRAATTLAGSSAGAELHFVHVVEPIFADGPHTRSASEDRQAAGRKLLVDVSCTAAQLFSGRIESHLCLEIAATGILQTAADLAADIIVVGSHSRHGFQRMLLGSVSRVVVDYARCAVLVARPAAYDAPSVPAIAPPCPRCLETQRATRGETLWCARHAGRSLEAHLHSRPVEAVAGGPSLLRADA